MAGQRPAEATWSAGAMTRNDLARPECRQGALHRASPSVELSIRERGTPVLHEADEVLDETIQVAAELGSFHVTELADGFNLIPQSANDRLHTLLR